MMRVTDVLISTPFLKTTYFYLSIPKTNYRIVNKNKCILLVDDDSICNLISKKLIEKLGYKNAVATSLNGKEALDFIEKAITGIQKPFPQLILLDINMPEMDGWKFVETFEKLSKDIINNVKIVMLTSSISPYDIKKAESSTCIAEFVTKPVTLDTMKLILEKYT